MKNILDLHTHTISSGHAYSTLQENVQEAKRKGLKYYGMSDHAPGIPGGTHFFHFKNLEVIPTEIDGVRVLRGCELNIIDENGTVDLEKKILKTLDYCIASFHSPCYSADHSLEDNMKAYEAVCKNPYVQIIGHPDDGRYPCDYEKLALMAKETNTLIELNNSSLRPNASRINGPENCRKILQACKKVGCMIVLNSDAHISFDVGKSNYADELIEELNFPKELILNYNEEKLKDFITLK
ncbi:phosphatase [Anaerorhabdus furcosa]|uniref:Putative hydrolase n=1 Tax=Anaerorhabdus furcosa TaxID=118967 RepID=A0A1T4N8R5_9FIRM|nr:phosphatase [Anaerorhabdus furcosa]SJZ75624.1 putative hydrolase [Anaerorhabdus furcosa]